MMPDAARQYSSSELLLKYSPFNVIMDHSALKQKYCSLKPAKTICKQKFVEEISDFSFDFQQISGKQMFVSDFLSHFSSDNNIEEPIPYLTDTSLLYNDTYITQLDAIYKFNYKTG